MEHVSALADFLTPPGGACYYKPTDPAIFHPREVYPHEATILAARAGRCRPDLCPAGHGLARRNPDDQEVTQIGEEIAAARALSDLAHQLLSGAAGQIEGITHQRADLAL